MKTKHKYIGSTLLLTLSLSIPILATSCASTSNSFNNIDLYKLPNYKNVNPDYNITPNPQSEIKKYESIDHTQFISERTFSLKMVSEPDLNGTRSIGYGTGWLFAKDTNSELTYYLATNLHVAGILFNSGKKAYEYDGKTYKLKENKIFNEIQFGQVITESGTNNEYTVGTTESKLNYSKTYYTQKVEKEAIEFSYLTFDMFNKMNLVDKDKVYNEKIIKNATQDLAILKIDFSKRSYIDSKSKLYNTDPILKSLNAYNANPTRFASTEYKNNSYIQGSNLDITVGGFPYEESLFSRDGNGAWKTSNSFDDEITYNGQMLGSNFSKKNWKQNIATSDMDLIKRNYILQSNIPFITNDYASYVNTSLQALFKNLNLSGGSSGSMAINNRNEVIGIYWGTYNSYSNNDFQPNILGAIDLFVNSNDKTSYGGLLGVSKYNTISDFVARVENTNLK